jgi:hypothetical protein
MSEGHAAKIEELKARLERVLGQFAHPAERRIGYGNIRKEYSTWGTGENATTNIAVVYETPGGSTAQVNIACDHAEGTFTYLDRGLETRKVSTHGDEVMRMLQDEIQAIPGKRMSILREQIRRWVTEGASRRQVFGEMNKLLQSEFIGGKITNAELRNGIKYAIELIGTS